MLKHSGPTSGSNATPGKRDGCMEPGCHKTQLQYSQQMREIVSVINLSAECQQSIMTNCTNTPLRHFAWWNDRHNQKQEYWNGDFSDGKKGCKCATEEAGCHATIFGTQVGLI